MSRTENDNPFPKLVSVDDHLIEPAHLWQSRLPAKYKDVGPRVEILPRGEMKIVDGDPSVDIGCLRDRVVGVMKDGVFHREPPRRGAD